MSVTQVLSLTRGLGMLFSGSALSHVAASTASRVDTDIERKTIAANATLFQATMAEVSYRHSSPKEISFDPG